MDSPLQYPFLSQWWKCRQPTTVPIFKSVVEVPTAHYSTVPTVKSVVEVPTAHCSTVPTFKSVVEVCGQSTTVQYPFFKSVVEVPTAHYSTHC